MIRVVWAQFPHSPDHTELCGKYWATIWRLSSIMSHRPTMSHLSVLLPTFFLYLHINNGWHNTTSSPWGRCACKYPLALHFITCPQKNWDGRKRGMSWNSCSGRESCQNLVFHIPAGLAMEQITELSFYSSSIKQQNAHNPASSDT